MRRTAPADKRGDRLKPGRCHSRFYVLTRLRQEMEHVIAGDLPESNGDLLVVDLGCGKMPYRPLFEAAGCRYLGADLPGNGIAELTIGDDGRVQFEDGGADVVVSTQVLEHVDEPSAYLAEAWRCLRPGGRIVLSTHGYWMYHPDPGDYWRWTASGLKRTVEMAGFTVVRLSGVVGLGASGLQLLQDGTIGCIPRVLRKPYAYLINRSMYVADRVTTGASRAKDAAVFIVIGEK